MIQDTTNMLLFKPVLFTKWAPEGLRSTAAKRLAPRKETCSPDDAVDALLSLAGIQPRGSDPMLEGFLNQIISNQNAAYRVSKKQCRVHICKAEGCSKIFPSLSRLARHEKVHVVEREKKHNTSLEVAVTVTSQ